MATGVQHGAATQCTGLPAPGAGVHQPNATERIDYEPSSLIRTGTTTGGRSDAYRAIDLRFHDLRHEAGSRWLEAGMPLHHVKELLDHASIATTDTYLNAARMPAKRKRTRSPRTRTQKRPELRLIEDPGEVWAVMYPLGALPPLVFPPGKPDGVDCSFRKFIIWKAELDQKRDNLEVGVEAFVVGGIKWISVYLVHYVV